MGNLTIMFSLEILESVLLLTLLVNILRSNFLANQYLIIALAIFTAVFFILSFLKFLKLGSFWAARFWLVLLIMAVLYGFWIGQIIARKGQDSTINVHDGVILTDAATRAIISGKNPYVISYKDEFAKLTNKPSSFTYNHFMYSPLTFLINVPQELIFRTLGTADLRITLTVFLFLTAVLGAFMVKEKILFLIIFALNPLFIPLTFYGANEVTTLFFLMAALALLNNGKITLSSIMLAMATGTKLLALPFVPLYFIYLFLVFRNPARGPVTSFLPASARSKRNSKHGGGDQVELRAVGNLSTGVTPRAGKFKSVIYGPLSVVRQIGLFLLVSLIIYLPFFVWGPGDLIEDLVFYHLAGGRGLHVIAGFVGIPQLLVNLGLIESTSNFPFYIFQAVMGILALVPAWYILKKFASPAVLCLVFVFYFLAIFAFSRIIQVSYLAFLSEVLLLAGFIHKSKA